MKTKSKQISILIIALLMFTASIAQKGFYVNSNTAYNFGLAPISLSANYYPGKIESVHGSFGKGLDIGIGGGYRFSNNIAADVNFCYLIGSEIDFKDASNTSTPAETEILKGRTYRLIPAIKISSGEKFKPYTKIGLVIGLGNKLIDESVRYNYLWSGGTDKIEETTVFSGGISLGFKGSIGVDYSINDKLGLFAEVNFISQSWAPKKNTTTAYLVNGEDKLATLDKRDKETEFVDSYDPNATIQPNEANKSLKIYLPFSSWGINVGIKYTFGKKE